MAKYSLELKLEAILAYLNGNESIRAVAKRFNVSKTPLETWIAQYRENGEKGLIREICEEHQGRYGYRRITLELRNRGIIINHKTVQRLMNEGGLKVYGTNEKI